MSFQSRVAYISVQISEVVSPSIQRGELGIFPSPMACIWREGGRDLGMFWSSWIYIQRRECYVPYKSERARIFLSLTLIIYMGRQLGIFPSFLADIQGERSEFSWSHGHFPENEVIAHFPENEREGQEVYLEILNLEGGVRWEET